MLAKDPRIDQARAVPIEEIISSLKLRKSGLERIGPCPQCGGHDRFSINVKKQVFNCRGCGKAGDTIALTQFIDGCSFPEALDRLAGPRQPSRELHPPPHSNDNRDYARRIWLATKDLRGTIGEAYLNGRGLALPPGASEFLRFHTSCPFGNERHPALIALIRNIITNKPQAIQRTALSPDGKEIRRDGKTWRMTLGPAGGGGIKISPDEDVTAAGCLLGLRL
jgi:hypothetical protein